MTLRTYVPHRPIQQAIQGRETEVLEALGIRWADGAPHINCPYPDHADANPSWRWDETKRRAHCSCSERSQSIFDVVMRCENLDFESAKLRVAEIIGRQDLIEVGGGKRHQAMDAASLLRPPPDRREDTLVRNYLGHRLGVPPDEVPVPSTPVAGWRALPYYDPPAKKGCRPKLVGLYPCLAFGTIAPDGRRHAHRIYVRAGGIGKAELGSLMDGRRRDAKKAAPLRPGETASGCAVIWGDPEAVDHLILAEGIETAAAVAWCHREKIQAGLISVASALSAAGIRTFQPWSGTRRITIAADRDEGCPPIDLAYRAGEKAARAFALAHQQHVEVWLALPGLAGQDVDWLDALLDTDERAVRAGLDRAEPLLACTGDSPDESVPSESHLEVLIQRAKADQGAPFEAEALRHLASVRYRSPATYQRVIHHLKETGVRLRDLDREVRLAGLKVIQGGVGEVADVVEAGPYSVTDNGVIVWRKETRDGVLPQPLCNFVARITAEEVMDNGAERHTVFMIEGVLQGGRRLPSTRVPADRYPAMNWVTEAWGMAPVIFAGQGKRDHLRVAIQMLSGSVERKTVYGHLGWRRLQDRWTYLHHGAAIGGADSIEAVEVNASADGLLGYHLPEAPLTADETAAAVRASLAILDVGADGITMPLLGAVYRAPLGEAAPIDFSIHLTGPTGVFKSELAALAQAHFGAAFNSRSLPASWADTSNMLEKKAFLAKDAVMVVDDFAPTGTTADVQRVHREADRLFRGAGNRTGRARMRADGSSRPTYYARGLIVSTGEDVPSGQSLRARLLVLELAPGDVDPGALSIAQREAAEGVLAKSMAGYLQWLSLRLDELRRDLAGKQRALREELSAGSQHRRTPEVAASLIAGWETFLSFAEEVGAVDHREASQFLERARAAMVSTAEMQSGHQISEEPAARFLALLGATLGSGRAHVADAGRGEAPDEPEGWGWQRVVVGTGPNEREEWRSNGERVGWLDGDDLYLDPEASFAAVQKLARDQGSNLAIKARTLWKRLVEQGHIVSRDLSRRTNTVRRTIRGRRLDVIHLRAGTFTGRPDRTRRETAQSDQPAPRKNQKNQSGGQFGQEVEASGPDQPDLRQAVGWEVDI